MNDKTLYTFLLGGKDVTLKFNVGTLRKLKGLLGKDPLLVMQSADTVDALDLAESITIAGMLSHDAKVDVSKVPELFNELMPVDATAIITAFSKAYTPDPVASTEVIGDTQQPAA